MEAQKDLPPSADLTAPGTKADYSQERNYDYPNRLYAATRRGQQPFLAFLAGRPGRFSSLEHAYYSGDAVSKQMIFSNDAMTPQDVRASWKIIRLRDNKTVAQGQWNGTLAAGEIRKIPFRCGESGGCSGNGSRGQFGLRETVGWTRI